MSTVGVQLRVETDRGDTFELDVPLDRPLCGSNPLYFAKDFRSSVDWLSQQIEEKLITLYGDIRDGGLVK